MVKNILTIGNRIPMEYFVTSGVGESDITYHAGSMHLALKSCGIETCNIMKYSSILPAIAIKLEKPHPITHGEVAECIISECTRSEGEIASAGIIYGWLIDKETGVKYGGLVCEREGSYSEDDLKYELEKSLNELYINGFEEKYKLENIETYLKSFIPTKKYGTAMVALVFQSYKINVKN